MSKKSKKINNTESNEYVAEESNHSDQNVRLHLAQRDLRVEYANAFQTHHLPEEFVVDFGLQLPVRPEDETQQEISFEIGQRVVMNYSTAQRLMLVINDALQEHQERMKQAVEAMNSETAE